MADYIQKKAYLLGYGHLDYIAPEYILFGSKSSAESF